MFGFVWVGFGCLVFGFVGVVGLVVFWFGVAWRFVLRCVVGFDWFLVFCGIAGGFSAGGFAGVQHVSLEFGLWVACFCLAGAPVGYCGFGVLCLRVSWGFRVFDSSGVCGCLLVV